MPVPQIVADFYDGSEFKGHFGVGPGFFECHRDGDFASKRCGGRESRAFLEILGLLDYPLAR